MSLLQYGGPALPVAFGGGPCNRLYTSVPGATPSDPALLIPAGTAAPARGAQFTSWPLQPVAATAGALMYSTFAAPTMAPGPRAEVAADVVTTPWSFGPLTNSSVMAFDAVASVAPAPARLVNMGRPWPVAETAVGYVAQQDIAAGQGAFAPTPSGPGCFVPSWPGAQHIVSQGTWTATPWRSPLWGCPGLL